MYRLRHLSRLLSKKELAPGNGKSIKRPRVVVVAPSATAMEHTAMEHASINSGTDSPFQRCCYVRCATEIIQRTQSYDCVRIYHCHDATDSRNSEQGNPPTPIAATKNFVQTADACIKSPTAAPISPVKTSDRAQRRKEKKLRKRQLLAQMRNKDMQPLSLRVTTTKFHPTLDKNATTQSIVHVKPLIVLDLNGILCHRVRKTPQSSSKTQAAFRPSCGNISNTDIIPRSDLVEFLTLLHGNFCLGVWTSATRKTSKLLVEALFPTNIRERLIFVWHRSSCQLVKKNDVETSSTEALDYSMDCIDNYTNKKIKRKKQSMRVEDSEEEVAVANDDDATKTQCTSPNSTPSGTTIQFQDDVTAIKSLSKVWATFPLWDATNTILLDDSPEKCPSQFRANALHPPPIKGTVSPRFGIGVCSDEDFHSVLDDDEINQRRQRDFFQLLAKHWEHPAKTDLTEFLEHHAYDHVMRWKTES